MKIKDAEPDGRKSTKKVDYEVISTFLKVTCACINLLTTILESLSQ